MPDTAVFVNLSLAVSLGTVCVCVSPLQLRPQAHVPEEPSGTDHWKLLDPHEPKKHDLRPFKKGR